MSETTYRRKIGLKEQLVAVGAAAAEAQKRIDFDSAHNDEVLAAISIVEDFLRDRGRVCYGGTAMNVQLPAKYRFYDPQYTIPDYDFLTPNSAADIENLEKRFRAAGFTEIGIRPGMHEGTTKVYINFTPVADITEIDPKLYAMFRKRAVTISGISYMDVNSLFMMMYLELSRPRGEVDRWEKVYERILLLQYARPMTACRKSKSRDVSIPLPTYRALLFFALRNGRVLAGAQVVSAYRESLKRHLKAKWFFTKSLPLILYSPALEEDAEVIKSLLGGTGVKVINYNAVGDFIPPMTVIKYLGRPTVLLVEQTACHSYNTLELTSGQYMRIASLDTLITLYLNLTLSDKSILEEFFPRSILCMAQQSIELSNYMRRHPKESQFPFISIECAGYQAGLPTLLREKFARIRKIRNTRKNSNSLKVSATKSSAKVQKTRRS
jgi:hypothetical protein